MIILRENYQYFAVNFKVVEKNVIAVFLLLFSLDLVAQKNKKQEEHLLTDNTEFFEGSIMLNTGEELKGLIKYNDRNGVLSYENGNDSRVFTAMRVSAFEFFDESVQKQRVFYTFKYEDSETNVERPQFFEMLRDYETFAILSRTDRIIVEEKIQAGSSGFNPFTGTYNPTMASPNAVKLIVSQTETIYVINSAGEIKPYFKFTNVEDGKKSWGANGRDTKTKHRMIDSTLLLDYMTAEQHLKLLEYADANDLDFSVKEDFIKVLDYYDALIGK